jgi:hypothetical protein
MLHLVAWLQHQAAVTWHIFPLQKLQQLLLVLLLLFKLQVQCTDHSSQRDPPVAAAAAAAAVVTAATAHSNCAGLWRVLDCMV